MGNLLAFTNSFKWADSAIDRNIHIGQLNEAVLRARSYGDRIFIPRNFIVEIQNLISFIYQYSYDSAERIQHFPWLTQSQHNTLVNIFHFFIYTTNQLANDLDELNAEFPNEANGYIGLFENGIHIRLVYNVPTWMEFHRMYVSQFNLQKRKDEFIYFSMFFRGELVITEGEANNLIATKKVPSEIKMLHNPNIPHELCHVHFDAKTNVALNIDGTWKHYDGKYLIKREVCEILTDWGFRLPDEYYE